MRAISVIMPAYMEAENIRSAVQNTTWALHEAKVEDYEIIIIDCLRRDGTHDGTPEIADSLAKQDNHIKVLHNTYTDFGAKYWIGVDTAKFPYTVMVPGDNELARETLHDMLVHLGEADILTTYAVNPEIRPLGRQIMSNVYTFLVNISSGLDLCYYNGACIHKADILRSSKDRNTSPAYMAKLLVSLIKSGHSYKEIPMTLQKRGGGKSSILTSANVRDVGKTIFDLFWQYRIRGK